MDTAGRHERDRGTGRRALGASGPRRGGRLAARSGRHRAAACPADGHAHGRCAGRAAVVPGRRGGRRRGAGRRGGRLPGQAVLLARAAGPGREPPAAGPRPPGRRAPVPGDGRLDPRADLGGRPGRAPGVRQPRVAGLHRGDRHGRRAGPGLAQADPSRRPRAVPLGHRRRRPGRRRRSRWSTACSTATDGTGGCSTAVLRSGRPTVPSDTSGAAWTSTPSTGSSAGTGSTPRSASRWSARSPAPAGPTSSPGPSSTKGSRTSPSCTRRDPTAARRRSPRPPRAAALEPSLWELGPLAPETGPIEHQPIETDRLDAALAALPDAQRAAWERLRIGSAMVVPLPARGRTGARLTVGRCEPGAGYTADDLDLVSEIGRRAGLAVDNARLLEQERATAQRLGLLHRATARMSAAATAGDVAAIAADHIVDLLDADYAGVWELRGQWLRALTGHGWDEALWSRAGQVRADAPLSFGEVLRERVPLWLSSSEEWTRRFPSQIGLVPEGAESIGYLPLVAGGRALGVLAVGFQGRTRAVRAGARGRRGGRGAGRAGVGPGVHVGGGDRGAAAGRTSRRHRDGAVPGHRPGVRRRGDRRARSFLGRGGGRGAARDRRQRRAGPDRRRRMAVR